MNAHVAIDPHSWGYRLSFRFDQITHCPGCTHTHWLVGRSLAECALCGTAVPIDGPPRTGKLLPS